MEKDNKQRSLVQKAMDALRQAFAIDEEAKPEAGQKFLDATLTDGTLIEISGEDIVAGASVSLKTDDGLEQIPDGEYSLDSGVMITTVDGVITDVVEGEAEETEADPEAEAEMNEEFASVRSLKSIEARLNAVEDDLKSYKSKYNTQQKRIDEFTEKFEGLEGKFSNNEDLYAGVKSLLLDLKVQPQAKELKPKRSSIKQSKSTRFNIVTELAKVNSNNN